ncbi:permease [Candidatus Bipolaricaulota bacterium]
MQALEQIGRLALQDLGRVWLLLVISIPFAVFLRVSGVSKKLTGAFGKRPVIGILLATAAGAFGPFCSCSIIPVIAAMLIGGVPLAPVMSFWIASPTMDPEIFLMSVAFLGWPLAVGRLVATLILSLAAGFITLWAVRRGSIGTDFIRAGATGSKESVSLWVRAKGFIRRTIRKPEPIAAVIAAPDCGCSSSGTEEPSDVPARPRSALRQWLAQDKVRRVLKESVATTLWVGRFMLLAFVLEAVIKLYVPQDLIVQWVGRANPWAPALAALVGIPIYTGNLMAVPLIGGLLSQGMSSGAALAFLIAGPITTIPAMAAVWGVVKRKVFLLYLGIGLVGAVVFGYLYQAVAAFMGDGG